MKDQLEKESALQQLIELAKTDGVLSSSEQQFLQSISTSLGLTQERFNALVAGEKVPFSPSQKEEGRLIQLYRLILMMHVDLKAGNEEAQTVRTLGMRVGLPALMTEALIDESKQSETGQIMEKRLLEIWRIHNN